MLVVMIKPIMYNYNGEKEMNGSSKGVYGSNTINEQCLVKFYRL